MRRRLLVAKAMVHHPPVLVLDEPTAGVDVELRQQLAAYVKDLNRAGTTVLLTTHYLEEAEQLCDRIAIINHGRLIANEPTRDTDRQGSGQGGGGRRSTAISTVHPMRPASNEIEHHRPAGRSRSHIGRTR